MLYEMALDTPQNKTFHRFSHIGFFIYVHFICTYVHNMFHNIQQCIPDIHPKHLILETDTERQDSHQFHHFFYEGVG